MEQIILDEDAHINLFEYFDGSEKKWIARLVVWLSDDIYDVKIGDGFKTPQDSVELCKKAYNKFKKEGKC